MIFAVQVLPYLISDPLFLREFTTHEPFEISLVEEFEPCLRVLRERGSDL